MFDSADRGKWWDKSWSLIDGCTQCSPGCDRCWLRAIQRRFKRLHEPRFMEDRLDWPLGKAGPRKPAAYAVWSDLFHEAVSGKDRELAFDVMRSCPQHVFIVLTKRAYRISPKLRIPENVWLGVTACNQKEVDRKAKFLAAADAGVKFLSYEPALGPVDLSKVAKSLSWLLCGSETGPGARKADIDWFRSVRDQCVSNHVALMSRTIEKGSRSIDGIVWSQLPRRQS